MSQSASRSPRRQRLLMVAYCCSPYQGSEPGMGWNFAMMAAQEYETWVICEERKFADEIQRYLDEHGPIPNLNFVFVPEKAWAGPMWRIPGLGYLSYHWWHQRACELAKQLHAKHQFDFVHQANIIGFREPGEMWRLGLPFVWGPIGGVHDFDARFLGEASRGARFKESLRSWLNTRQLKHSRKVHTAARQASAIISANRQTAVSLREVGIASSHVMSELCLDQVQDETTFRAQLDGGIRLLWSGGFEPRKALSLLLKALAQLPPDVPFQLDVVGDGEERKHWRELAKHLGIDDRIRWCGWVSRDEMLEKYAQADAFVFTSLRDTTGTVLLEALSRGLPVICPDHQGAADIIADACGIKVPVNSPRQVSGDLAKAITTLSRDSGYRRSLAEQALLRARCYTREHQAARLHAIYRGVLESSSRDRCEQLPAGTTQHSEENRTAISEGVHS